MRAPDPAPSPWSAPPRGGADLHNHTTASDGRLTPSELVERAAAAGIEALGVTDHDTAEGLPEAEAAARRLGIRLVPGVELSTEAMGEEVHILGYFARFEAPPLAPLMETMRRAREERIGRMVARLRQAGYPVEWERVRAIAGDGAIGRPHLAHALVEAGLARDLDDAFRRYLLPGRPGYVPRLKLAADEAIRAIHEGGGAAVVAHPGLLRSAAILGELVAAGLDGIEVWHADHRRAQSRRLLALAEREGLLVTGGSDFHAHPGRRDAIGVVRVALAAVDALEERAARWSSRAG